MTKHRNATENYSQSAENIRENAENYAKLLEKKGIEPDPAYAESEDQYLAFLDAVGPQLPVVKIGGVWKVDPFSPAILIPAVRDPDEDTEETEEIDEFFEEESEP